MPQKKLTLTQADALLVKEMMDALGWHKPVTGAKDNGTTTPKFERLYRKVMGAVRNEPGLTDSLRTLLLRGVRRRVPIRRTWP